MIRMVNLVTIMPEKYLNVTLWDKYDDLSSVECNIFSVIASYSSTGYLFNSIKTINNFVQN